MLSAVLAATDPAAGGGSLVDALIVLATAGVAAVVMRRLRFEVVPAYLAAGMLLGPGALAAVSSPDSLDTISHAAIILLMFGIGLHMDLSMLASGVGVMIAAGVACFFATTLLGWPVAIALGLSPPGALAACMALSMSSTAVVLRILAERRLLRRPPGRLAFLILIVQDLLVIGVLAALPAIARWNGVDTGTAAAGQAPTGMEGMPGPLRFLADASLKLGAVSAIIVVGRLALPPLLREAAAGHSREVMLVLSTAAALGSALATQAVGFSPELGAFLAGLLLASTPFRHQLSGQIGPLRDLFIAVFFTTVGMKVDASSLAQSWWIVLLGCGALLAMKGSAIAVTCWAVGAAPTTALTVGLALAQAGEFSLVLLDASAGKGLLSPASQANLTAIVALSLVLTPSLISLAEKLRPRALRIRPAPWIRVSPLLQLVERAPARDPHAAGADGADHSQAPLRLGHVVLAGYGVVGRAVADKLDALGVKYTIIEFNPATVARQTALGRSIVYGDVSNPDVLESAGVAHADAVILTVPDEDAVLRACQTVRSLNPKAFIAARTNFLSKGMLATSLGADIVTIEEIATAEAMAWEVTKQLSERAISGGLAPTSHVAAGQTPVGRPEM